MLTMAAVGNKLLKEGKHHEESIGYCLGCLHLRQGVQLYAGFLLAWSFLAAASLVTEDARFTVGGYTWWTRLAVGLLGIVGLAACGLAFIGLGDNHESFVRFFNYFSILRIVTLIVFLAVDWDALLGCGAVEKNHFRHMQDTHYNVALEHVALNGECARDQVWYLACAVSGLVVSIYGTYTVSRWCHQVENCPSYLIALDETKPLFVYTGFSNLGYVRSRDP